jgi:archaellum component FlaC
VRQREREPEKPVKETGSEPGLVRKFRSNFASYVSVNGGLLLLNVVTTGIDNPWFLFPAIGWGIGLASQYGKLWAEGYSMRDVLNPPPARDALPASSDSKHQQSLAALPKPSSDDFGRYTAPMEQMHKDRAAIVQTVQKLPESDREMLPDVVQTVDQLIGRASDLARTLNQMEGGVDPAALEELEERIKGLKQEASSVENDRRVSLLERQRDSLSELLSRRDGVESQFESCALAVQNMRFDLLRLRSAGVSAVLTDLTSATQQAQALRIDVEAAIGAAGEIRDALGKGGP